MRSHGSAQHGAAEHRAAKYFSLSEGLSTRVAGGRGPWYVRRREPPAAGAARSAGIGGAVLELIVRQPVDAEVIVLGAGPAGAATAMHLARAGIDVLLVDR